MKIAVVGAKGRVGSLVVKEAKERGLEVVELKKRSNELTKEDLKGFDAVVDAVGGWTPETIPNITNAMKDLADLLKGTNTRLLVVGGAGSLFVNKERTVTVDMGPDFPDDWKPLSNAHGAGLAYLRNSKDLNWTYISPACVFNADGERTTKYILGGEDLVLNSKGESTLSYADFAFAMVDEIINAKHIKERISVVSE